MLDKLVKNNSRTRRSKLKHARKSKKTFVDEELLHVLESHGYQRGQKPIQQVNVQEKQPKIKRKIRRRKIRVEVPLPKKEIIKEIKNQITPEYPKAKVSEVPQQVIEIEKPREIPQELKAEQEQKPSFFSRIKSFFSRYEKHERQEEKKIPEVQEPVLNKRIVEPPKEEKAEKPEEKKEEIKPAKKEEKPTEKKSFFMSVKEIIIPKKFRSDELEPITIKKEEPGKTFVDNPSGKEESNNSVLGMDIIFTDPKKKKENVK